MLYGGVEILICATAHSGYTLICWDAKGTLYHGGKRYAADSRSSVLNRPSQRLGELTAKSL